MSKAPISEKELLNLFSRTAAQRLPSSWRFTLRPGEGNRRRKVDALAEVQSSNGTRGLVLIEIKRRLYPKDVQATISELRRQAEASGAASAVVLAPFIGPRTKDLLAEAEIGYADATGNFRLQLTTPATLINLDGARSNPWPDDKLLRSLKGPSAGRVVRAFCDFTPPFGVEEISRRSRTSIASVSRVATLLDREALVTRDARGRILGVDWPKLIARWTLDYSLLKSNRTRMYVEPRALSEFLAKLAALDAQYAVTGSLPASLVAPFAASRLAVVYADDPEKLADQLRVSQVDEAGNVLLVEPFDPVVFDRTWQRDGVTYAALTQVAADLLTSPGRGPSEGQALLGWMAENQGAWRA